MALCCLPALGAIPYNLANEQMSDAARYGLSFIDIVVITGFAFAVLMAVKSATSLEDHARWMISTVFWSILPGLFRLVLVALHLVFDGKSPVGPPQVLAAIGALNIVVLGYLMFRDRRAHPAYLTAAAGSAVYFVALPVSQMAWWRGLADMLFTI